MNRILTSLSTMMMIVIIVFFASCRQDGLSRELRELDKILERSEDYTAKMESFADSLRAERDKSLSDSVKWELTYALFKEYVHINVGTSKELLNDLERYSVTDELKNRTVVCKLRVLKMDDDVEAMSPLLLKLQPSLISESFRAEYIRQVQRVLSRLFEAEKMEFIKTALSQENLPEYLREGFKGKLLCNEGRYEDAIGCFARMLELTESIHQKAMSAYDLAQCYNLQNDRTSYLRWLIQAAKFDVQVPVKQYSSLWELSQELYKDGDYARSSDYMRFSLKDAIDGGWEVRAKDITTFLLAVSDQIDNSKSEKFRIVLIMALLLLVLLIVVFILYELADKQRLALKEKNAIISKLNDKLRDEGIIKEEYLFKYMDLSVSYLGKVSNYRHQLRQTLKEDGLEGIKAMLRKPDESESYKEFYRNFDETFLKIYPEFINQVNSFLKEDSKMKNDLPFSTELRILAVIRLGFKDSGQIARFLNMSPASIYTKRSFIRLHHARPDINDFEDKIRNIA